MSTTSSTSARTIDEVFREVASGRDWKSFIRWPPDVFALTSIILGESGAYVQAVSASNRWRQTRRGWVSSLERCPGAWRTHSMSRKAPAPEEIRKDWGFLEKNLQASICELNRPENARLCASILRLHVLADEACSVLGPKPVETAADSSFNWQAIRALTLHKSLSTLPPHRVQVLPKLLAPQTGISLRSLSRHLAIARSEVQVAWWRYFAEELCRDCRINVLLVPWPYAVDTRDFQQVHEPSGELESNATGFFRYSPRTAWEPGLIAGLVAQAQKVTDQIDMVVLPETALSTSELEILKSELAGMAPSPIYLAGVRDGNGAAFGANYVAFGTPSDGGSVEYRQDKHHRWCVDESQVRQYHLGAALHPSRSWWESIEIGARSLNIIQLAPWLSVCPLICEDLARQEPVSHVVRSIGPTLLVALLQDGPQLSTRWPARYASVFADDPGSSVLTLTSLGMALRSRPPGRAPSPVIALWKDKKTGVHEIPLDAGSGGVVLTVCCLRETTRTADGRSDPECAVLTLSGIQQIPRAPAAVRRGRARVRGRRFT